MIESLASGTPVIASELSEEVGGIEDGENSILIEPGDAHALTEAMQALLDNEELRSSMSESARESAEKEFSIESRIDRLEACYESLVSKSDG